MAKCHEKRRPLPGNMHWTDNKWPFDEVIRFKKCYNFFFNVTKNNSVSSP